MAYYAYVHVRPGADVTGVFYVGKGRKHSSVTKAKLSASVKESWRKRKQDINGELT